MPRNKYGNRKITVDGVTFDSKKEAARYRELRLMERAGYIIKLQRQTKFVLIPTQREPSGEIYSRGEKKGQPKPGKTIEHEVSYYADFTYWKKTDNDWKYVVGDVKGVRTEVYKIKRKLMLERYGIRISEV